MSKQKLHVYESLTLLSLKDVEGTLRQGSLLPNALSGAILADLMLLNRIRVSNDRKKKVIVLDANPTGDSILDECLLQIRDLKREKSIQTWITNFKIIKKLTQGEVIGKAAKETIDTAIMMVSVIPAITAVTVVNN